MASIPWDPRRLPEQTGKTVVVTGGNAGVGYFVSEQLAFAGARVILASRSEQRAAAAAASIRSRVGTADIEVVPLDLSSLASIANAADQLRALGRIDVLVNNAGATHGENRRVETKDGLELIVGSNAFGPFALTAQVFPALGEGSRIVSLGSMATRMVKADPDLQSRDGDYRFFRAYGLSKHAMHAFAFELDRRLVAAGRPVASLLAHPGYAVDGLAARRPGINDQSTGRRLADLAVGAFAHGKDRGAWPVVRAALDPDARSGQFYGPSRTLSGRPALLEPVAASASPAFGAEFWRQAEEATGVRFEV